MNYGWNVFIGEYGETDTDQLWLHGKNGIKLTYGRGEENYNLLSFDINEDVILINNTIIENNAEVKLKSCAFVEISGDSEVKLGSTLDIRIE